MMYITNKVTNSVQVIACLPALQRLNKFTFLREYKYASEWILQTFAAVMLYSGQTSNTLPFPLYLCIINDASSIYVVPVKLHVQLLYIHVKVSFCLYIHTNRVIEEI